MLARKHHGPISKMHTDYDRNLSNGVHHKIGTCRAVPTKFAFGKPPRSRRFAHSYPQAVAVILTLYAGKGALQLQVFANNILKNALNNSLQQGGDNFIPLPKIQNLVANTLQDKCAFAKAAIKGFRLEQKVIFMDRSKIDAYANWRRSIPTVEL